jgi:uncharacterized protein (TIGR02598 family)
VKHASRTHPCHSIEGFSLVEVAISVAVVSFSMLSILGLVPMGLTNLRQAMNNTIQSQIVQSITSQEQLTSFSNLQNATYLYDADGNTATSSAQSVYTATVTLSQVSGSSFPVNLASSADKVTIAIVNKTQPAQTNIYSIIIANQNN